MSCHRGQTPLKNPSTNFKKKIRKKNVAEMIKIPNLGRYGIIKDGYEWTEKLNIPSFPKWRL